MCIPLTLYLRLPTRKDKLMKYRTYDLYPINSVRSNLDIYVFISLDASYDNNKMINQVN